MIRCALESVLRSIVIGSGASIESLRVTLSYLLFWSGLGRRISAWLIPKRQEISTRVALYLALVPAPSVSEERARDEALEIVLDRM